jgi:hypothetical protein
LDLILLLAGVNDPGTLTAVLVFGAGLIIAAVLNRRGFVAAAATLIVVLVCVGVLGSLLSQPLGLLTLDALPAYDLLVLAVLVAASVLPRIAAFVVAAVNMGIITLDFVFQPHYTDITRVLNYYGGTAAGTAALLSRPIALQIIVAVVAYLWVRGADEAIRRADRAEELAMMEHTLAEQKRQLDFGIRQILDTHVRIANGDLNARAPLAQDNVLYQIASALNNLLSRMTRAAAAEFMLNRTVQEADRLVASIRAARQGRPPIWPGRTGTPLDPIIDELAGHSTPRPPQLGPWQGGPVGSPSGPYGSLGGSSLPSGGRPPTNPFANSPAPTGPVPAVDNPWALPQMPPMPDGWPFDGPDEGR